MRLRLLPTLLSLMLLAGCGSLGLLTGAGENAATLNEFRGANGLKPLQQDAGLTAMAATHSADMARRETLDHGGFRETRGARAENVAYGCADSPCTIRQWIKSSGHRTNMLRADVTKYGLGSAVSKSGRKYWTLLVGE
jgi:uncharacterized protein YkwD